MSDPSKICNLVAINFQPNLVYLPRSNDPETLSLGEITNFHDSTECYFKSQIELAEFQSWSEKLDTSNDVTMAQFSSPGTKNYEFYIDEAFIESIEVKIQRTKFLLPNLILPTSNWIPNQNNIDLDINSISFNRHEVMTSMLTNFDVMQDINHIYLTAPHQGRHVLLQYKNDQNNYGNYTKTSIATCSQFDGDSQNSFILEIDGVVYTRRNDNFEILDLKLIESQFGNVQPTVGQIKSQMMGNKCPKEMVVSPYFYLKNYVMVIFSSELKIFEYWGFVGNNEKSLMLN